MREILLSSALLAVPSLVRAEQICFDSYQDADSALGGYYASDLAVLWTDLESCRSALPKDGATCFTDPRDVEESVCKHWHVAYMDVDDKRQACEAKLPQVEKERSAYHARAWKAEGRSRWFEGKTSTLNRRIVAMKRACGSKCNGL